MRDVPRTVGASLRGHAYHHAWAARAALALLEPGTDLALIAVEQFSTVDASAMSASAVEVADLVRYYGGRDAQTARRIEVVQFKHSDAEAKVAFVASDAAKTIEKFTAAFRDKGETLCADRRNEVLRFELITNRPIHSDLATAVTTLAAGAIGGIKPRSQAATLLRASGLKGPDIAAFFSRLVLSGSNGNLGDARRAARRVIASWSEPADLEARQRLKELLGLVEDAATGVAHLGHGIVAIDVLGALGLAETDELFPAEASFPEVERQISRTALKDILAKMHQSPLPLIVHATGGMGKTVLMQALAAKLSEDGFAILFDGFGGGEWRNTSDVRHRASRGLLQLVNQIAARGLCDPILPGRSDASDLLRAARKRFEAALAALRNQGLTGGLSLVLDAVDHSAEQAKLMGEKSFASDLLKSMTVSPIDGVRLVISCRTERLPVTRGDVVCPDFEVPRFTTSETLRVIQAERPEMSATDVTIVTSRAQGNPRILAALLRQGPPYKAPVGPQPTPTEAFNQLLQQQLDTARANAEKLGATKLQLDSVLAGLALMPPPTPVEELAAAQGLSAEAVRSFVADMFPVLEETATGIIFRDEPTEFYVRELSRADLGAQARVLERLDERQTVSSHAARAYPVVLRNLRRRDNLYALAVDDRIPGTAVSDVARRAVRAARIDAALGMAAEEADNGQLFTLSLEAARLAGGQGRSGRFIREHPDLIAVAGDMEAQRRVHEDRTGWGGARHAMRAVHAWFAGEPAEALRDARHAIDWFNWWVGENNKDDKDARQLPTLGDIEIEGPAFVMVRSGRAAGTLLWLQSGGSSLAYRHLSGVVRLLERAAGRSKAEADWRLKAYSLVARWRCTSPVTILAIIANATALPSEISEAFAARLIAADLSKFEQSSDPFDRKPDFIPTLLLAAARELRYGRSANARGLLEKATIARPSHYDFEPPVMARRPLESWLLSGLLRAAIEGRPLRLIDVAPMDIDALVKDPADRANDQAYRAAIKTALAEPAEHRPDTSADDRGARADARRQLEACVQSRLPPLIDMLESLRPAVATGDFSTAVKSVAYLIREVVPKASNYPYSDQQHFLGSLLSDVAAALGRASDGLEGEAAMAMADALAASPAHHLGQQVRWVRLFAMVQATAAVATTFAAAIAAVVAKDDSLDARLTKYAELAYALWTASPGEAAAYVRLALEKADGLSGDDYEESQGLIGIAVHYNGPPLAQPVVHGFARLCEAQMPDEADRYIWREFSQALSRLGGLDGLAISARLEDREKGGLEYNHLMLTAYLVERERLSPELAVALVGLKSYRDFYVFRLTDFLTKVLPQLTPQGREQAFQFATVEWDRESLTGASRELARLFFELARQWLPASHPLQTRFRLLAGEASPDESYTFKGVRDLDEDDEIARVARTLDVTSSDALDSSLEAAGLKGDEPRLSSILDILGQAAATVEERLQFAEAVAGSQSVGLKEKLWTLTSHIKAWAPGSLMISAARRRLGETLITRHVDALMAGRWDSSYEFGRLLELAGDSLQESEAVALMLRHVQLARVQNRSAWLDAAARLASVVDNDRVGKGLVRYVELSEATLEPGSHGGGWTPERAVSDSEAAVVAGTLWRALGSTRAEERWRAAHAVRRTVAVGREDVLAALVGLFGREDARPHLVDGTPFRFLDARLWLLLVMDRIALEWPDVIAPYRATLVGVLTDETFPHVLMREVAARTLRRLTAVHGASPDDPDLSAVNQSAFSERLVSTYLGDGYYHPPPDDYVELNPPFHFDYDFDKTEVMRIARIFGAHRYETGDHIAGWIRRWQPDAANMWGGNRGWDRTPVNETWVGHLGWHGLFLTAGDFLQSRPLVVSEWDPNPMARYLEQELLVRKDGFWVADETVLTPPDAYKPRRHRDHLPRRSTLPTVIGLGEPHPERVVVNGSWKSGDEVEFWVRSALVSPKDARAAAAALSLSSQYDVWLPLQSDLDDYHHRDPGPFRPWLTALDLTYEAGLDLKDPYASSDARSGVRPADDMVGLFNLTAADPFQRIWTDRAGAKVLATEVWGGMDGRGHHGTDRSGHRTWAPTGFLRSVCQDRAATLIVLTYSSIYLKEKNDGSAFPGRWSVSLLDSNGVLPLARPSLSIRKAVHALDAESRREFDLIFATVQTAMG